MISTDLISARDVALKNLTTDALSAPENLELLRELEASLLRSRAALLALDLDGIAQGTLEQIELVRAMTSSGQREMQTERNPETVAADARVSAPEIAAELKLCAASVLQAGRVQAALLDRMQRKLRILGNMLAGPSVSYGCVLARDNAPVAYVMREGAF